MAQPATLIVCPTSHMDWDWNSSFEEYFKQTTGGAGTGPVQKVLNQAFSLFTSEPTFRFSLAEVAWLQRYLVNRNGNLPERLFEKLSFLGGGITSPDNIVCNGEVFVRNYLLGRTWVKSLGLAQALENVSWLPDDFGHDPELPVILSAMGLGAVGFARVPGAFPNYTLRLDQKSSEVQPSMARELMASGVAFHWIATDGSSVFAHFMPNTYGVPFASGGSQSNSSAWLSFVQSQYLSSSYHSGSSLQATVWPGGVAFAPAGGDFSVPDTGWVGGVSDFNSTAGNTTKSAVGTFSSYVNAVKSSGAPLVKRTLDPSNFWTGYFGSRPALKRLQAQASRDLVSAEALSSLLWLASPMSSAALSSLDSAIQEAWGVLVPSSHHDFITGTSPDSIYKKEQHPMLSLAASMAAAAYRRALQWVADTIPAPKGASGNVVAVYNPVGVARGGMFRLEAGASVSFNGAQATVQPLADGGILVQAPVVPALGYISGVVSKGQQQSPLSPVLSNDSVTLNNGAVQITISSASNWAITSIIPAGGTELLANGAKANVLQSYDDTGNLYQYGNEPMSSYSGSNGTFRLRHGGLTAGKAWLTEAGPLRWRAEAQVLGTNGLVYQLSYTLLKDEPLVRMEITGSAPQATTMVTAFPATAMDGVTQATRLTYGTAHHFHTDEAPAYWTGPVFKATHNFLMPAAPGSGATFALAAIYHDGMPAWACSDGQLLGSLFRNTDGAQRGASGTDTDTHTQRYALRISTTPLDPRTGQPLTEALEFAQPLVAAVASPSNQPESPVTLQSSASLASAPAPALVRVVRPMGVETSAVGTAPGASIALRIYRPDANGTQTAVAVTLPELTTASTASAALVTALEEPIPNAPPVSLNGNVLSVPTTGALTTVQLSFSRSG
jgi:alpha-mannosidase